MAYHIIESINGSMGPFTWVMIGGIVIVIGMIIIIYFGRHPDSSWF